jgi:hypothetical protein
MTKPRLTPHCLLVGALLAQLPAAGAATRVYQSKAADGSTLFSDQPSPQAREIDVKAPPPEPVSAAQSPRIPTAAPPVDQDGDKIVYTSLKITAPKNDDVFWFADGPVKVKAQIEPPLAKGHLLVPILNGVAQGDGVAGNEFALSGLDPDTYELVVVIRDANGRELKRSAPVRFHFKRQSLNLPARRPPARP